MTLQKLNLGTTMNTLSIEQMLDRVGKRRQAFEVMLEHVATCTYPLIVETGVSRQEDNYDGDGMSTLIWDAAANKHQGTVQCVDINPANCKFAKDRTSDKTMVYCGDSVKFLAYKEQEYEKLNRKIDLLYLDSYDLDIDNWHPSAQHHIYELLAIKGALKPGTLICVDDNLLINNIHIGKGTYVAEWMERAGKQMIYQGYQWIWCW